MTEAMVLGAIKLSVSVLILAIGMQSTVDDLTYLWRRPLLLLKSMLAMYVLVPLAAIAMVKILPLSFGLSVAVLVLAISAGAPLVPRKLMPLSNDGYVFSLIATSSLLAIVTVPAWVMALGAAFDLSIGLSGMEIGRLLGRSFVLPIVVGMAVQAFFPRIADKLSNGLMAVGGVVLTVGGLVLLVGNFDMLVQAGWKALFVLALLTALALAIGHLMGGPDSENRTPLAISCATRHIGVAVLVAAVVPGRPSAVLIVAYLVASMLAAIPYIRWRKKYHKAERAEAVRVAEA